MKEIWLHNSSGKPQFLAAMSHAGQTAKGRAVAIINQEHHCDASSWMDAQAQAGRRGWNAVAALATATKEGGKSAGVAIATPRGTSAGVHKKGEYDCSPRDSKGRLAKIWMQDLPPCGVTVLTVYLWHSEGHSERNMLLLSRAIEGASISGDHGS